MGSNGVKRRCNAERFKALLWFRVWGFEVLGLGFWGLGFAVLGFRYRVLGFRI